MRTLDISPEAELDVLEAALWYEGERPGLGLDVLTEEEFTVIAVLDLRRDPAIWQRRR